MIDKNPGLKIVQIFLESAQFSHCEGSLALPASRGANVGDVGLTMELGVSQKDKRNGLLRVTVATKPENTPVYEFRVAIVVLAQSDVSLGAPSVEDYLKTSGMMLAYPFVREAVANLTMRGRFGPIWLNPINPAPLANTDLEPERRGTKAGGAAGKRRSRKDAKRVK